MKVPQPPSGGAGQGDRGKTVESKTTCGPIASPNSTAREVADAAVLRWTAVAQALAPIIGQSSVTMLYRRCLASVGVDRSWLPPVTAADLPESDWAVLHASVSRQTAKEAAEACDSLFVAFTALLGSLIGQSLTAQLLSPVSFPPPTGSAEQDTLR